MGVSVLVPALLLLVAHPAGAASELLSRADDWRQPTAHKAHEAVDAAPVNQEAKPRLRAFLDSLSAGLREAEAAIEEREEAVAQLLEGRSDEDPSEEGRSDENPSEEKASGHKAEKEAEKVTRGDPDDAVDNRKSEGERSEREAQKKKKEFAGKGSHSTDMPVNEKWFTMWYWTPLLAGITWMTVTVDVLAPFYNTFFPFTLMSEVLLMSLAIFGFAFVVFSTMAPGSAGATILLANATLSSTIHLLVLLCALSLYARKVPREDPVMQLSTDVAKLYRPVLRVMMVCVLLQVITSEAKVDWSQLAMLMTFLMLGIALSLTGVIADIMAHIFIRLDNHFTEGDYIVWEDDLVQIERLEWRHAIGITDSSNAYVYIPNSQLTSDSLINQCEDNERKIEIDLAVEAEAADIKKCVNNAWAVLAEVYKEDFTFMGSDGCEYTNQFLVEQCGIWLKEDGMSVHIALYGKYFHSEPPPWGDAETPEPPMEERHFDWERGWYMQVEWFNLEVKRRNEELLKQKDTNWPAQDSR
jgi:small-conductance mechanosensitive channel